MQFSLERLEPEKEQDELLAQSTHHRRVFKFGLSDEKDNSVEYIDAEVFWIQEAGEDEEPRRTYRKANISFDPGLPDQELKRQMLEIIHKAMAKDGIELLDGRIFEADVVWTMAGKIKVNAKTEEEAHELVTDAPLPEGSYVDESFQIKDIREVKDGEGEEGKAATG